MMAQLVNGYPILYLIGFPIPFSIAPFFQLPASSMMGHTLNITKINRVHMGTYKCFADNGIPPTANATFNIEVQCEYFWSSPLLYFLINYRLAGKEMEMERTIQNIK